MRLLPVLLLLLLLPSISTLSSSPVGRLLKSQVKSSSWAGVRLTKQFQRAASSLYPSPTPVQSSSIPSIVAGEDVQITAPTGTGKTAAFTLPLLQSISLSRPADFDPENPLTHRTASLLILSPTRELTLQTTTTLTSLAAKANLPLTVRPIHGGVSIQPTLQTLQYGCDAIVATPGRLLDVVAKNGITLEGVEYLVLDEADRLLAGDFLAETEKVISNIKNPKLQVVCASATFSGSTAVRVNNLLKRGFKKVDTDNAVTPNIEFTTFRVESGRKGAYLKRVLAEQKDEAGLALVFVATKKDSDKVAQSLKEAGLVAESLNGDLSMGARISRLNDFRSGVTQILVCTDIAARGIDVSDVDCVVHYDLPRSPTDFKHRSGRTGRAGSDGRAVTFVTAENERHYNLCVKKVGVESKVGCLEGFEVDEEKWETGRAAQMSLEEVKKQMEGGVKSKTKKSKKDKLREKGLK